MAREMTYSDHLGKEFGERDSRGDFVDTRESRRYRLHSAIQNQNEDDIRYLLNLGGYDPNEQYELVALGNKPGETRCMTMLMRNLQYSNSRGPAYVDNPNRYGPQPGGINAYHPLLGAAPLIPNPQYNTARGSPRITELLLQHGADVDILDIHGETCLFHTMPLHKPSHDLGFDLSNMRLLLAAGADVNTVTHDGNTVLSRAHRQRYYRCMRVLLENGARVHDVILSCGMTNLARAALGLDETAIKLLFEFGADPDERSNYLTDTVGAMCAGHDGLALLFKDQRIARAYLEYNNFRDKMKAFSIGTLSRVSHQTHMNGFNGDLIRCISSKSGVISMEDRILSINHLAQIELEQWNTLMQPFQNDTFVSDSGSDTASDAASDDAWDSVDSESTASDAGSDIGSHPEAWKWTRFDL
jgi:ankyrin repeat protein